MDLQSRLSELDIYFSTLPKPTGDVSVEVTQVGQMIINFRPMLYRPEAQVTFFGAFKAGKSTLLNAIIGWPILPARTNRATGVITRLSYSQELVASVKRNTKPQPEEIFFDDIAQYILLDVSEGGSKAKQTVEEVRIGLPVNLLKNRCNLSDTPGLMDNQALTERTYRELEQADLGVMILSADKLVSEVERDAAQRAQRLLNGNLVFVINRLGMVDEEDREDILDWAHSSFKNLGNGLVGQPRIFATEAKATLEARKGQTSTPLANGLHEFEVWLQNLLDGPNGQEVLVRARLSILHSHLVKANDYLQTEYKAAQMVTQNLQNQAERDFAERLARHNARIAQEQLNFSRVKAGLGALCDVFQRDVMQRARYLLDTDPNAARKLNTCLDTPLQVYARNVQQSIRLTVPDKNFILPNFALRPRDNGPTPEPNFMDNPFEAMNSLINNFGDAGDWVGKNLFGDNRPKILVDFEREVERMLPALKSEAGIYADKIAKLWFENLQKSQPVAQQSQAFAPAQQTERYLANLVKWSTNFRMAVNKKIATLS